MSVICIARQHNEKDVKFVVSYLKESVWLRNNGDARVTLHCVIRAAKDSAPFSALRIIVPENVANFKDISSTLFEEDFMRIYEDEANFEILSKDDRHVRGNGGEYYVTDALVNNIKPIENYTEFSVKLTQPVTPLKARGFRIEYISHQYAKGKNTFLYNIEIYNRNTLHSLQAHHKDCTDIDIMDIEYGDLWVVLPRNAVCGPIISSSNLTEHIELKNLSKKVYSREWGIENNFAERIAYRWRISKCDINSGCGADSSYSPPRLPNWYTYLAIVLSVLGILLSIFRFIL